jgi:hypothetical protein
VNALGPQDIVDAGLRANLGRHLPQLLEPLAHGVQHARQLLRPHGHERHHADQDELAE